VDLEIEKGRKSGEIEKGRKSGENLF